MPDKETTVAPDGFEQPVITPEVAKITGQTPTTQETKPAPTVEKKPEKSDKSEAVDWKLKYEESEKQKSEMQGGLTPKLQEAAKIREENERLKQIVGQLTGVKEPAPDPTKSNITDNLENEIREIEGDINLFINAGYTEKDYEVRNLRRNLGITKRELEYQRDREISRQSENELREFYGRNVDLDPKVYGELGKIIEEKRGKKEIISLDTALEIYEKRSGVVRAEQKVKENLEAKTKSEKAQTQTGEQISTEISEDEELVKYRNRIAPPDPPIDLRNSE